VSWGKHVTLERYIESLFRRGLTGQDEEFQILIRVFGKERIVNLGLEIKTRIAAQDEKGHKHASLN
jgi:hypothetical protein